MDTKERMDIQEIETAITYLSTEDVTKLMEWLADYHAEVWDEQIERDLESGRLDSLLKEVDEEYEAGLSQPL
jgi:hypothetical protein